MHWNARTVLRAFLLLGGLAFLVSGLVGGETLTAGIGAVAVVLGVIGLAAEWNESAA